MRPRGSPPTPSAMSRPSEPVETTSMPFSTSLSPIFMIEPLPNCFSIWESAACRAFALFSSILGISEFALLMTLSIGLSHLSSVGRFSPGLARTAHESRHHTENLQAPARANDRVGFVRGLQDERAL